eukprot:GDKI01002498.1.p1 GENE.GDKI01002498.1~~GDKI01002498.1.p1  ORF type:complete len:259 (-),score=37.64 GDKI01002498.1:25-801(-)
MFATDNRWGANLLRDQDGLFFVDEDPELFKILLNHLRTVARSGEAGKYKQLPSVCNNKRHDWESMLAYFGFINPSLTNFAVFSDYYPQKGLLLSKDRKKAAKRIDWNTRHTVKPVYAMTQKPVLWNDQRQITWTLCMTITGPSGSLCFGLMDDAHTDSVLLRTPLGFAWRNYCSFDQVGAKETPQEDRPPGYIQRFENSIKDGDMVELCLDTHTRPATVSVQVVYPIPWPADLPDWNSYRLVGVLGHPGQGVEIVSVS